jgi:hypothetical protein
LAVAENDYDLWNSTATFKACVLDESATDVKIAYRTVGATEWTVLNAAAGSNNEYSATATSFAADKTYEYKLVYGAGDMGRVLSIETPAGAQIPNCGFEEWSTSNKVVYPYAEGTMPFWLTGNDGSKIANITLTQSNTDTRPGSTGQYSAYLKSQSAVGMLAAGNLFTGTFRMLSTTNGVVGFGRDFNFTAKPHSYTFWMKNKEGQINSNSGKPASGTDLCSIMVLITDWTEPYEVNTSDSNTFLTNEKIATMDGVIAYGIYQTQDSHDVWTEKTIQLTYREDMKNRKPRKVVVSFTPSGYGDYFCGSTDSEMYVDDFCFNY